MLSLLSSQLSLYVMGLFLGFLFCAIHLFLCLYVSIILFWSLQLYHKSWYQVVLVFHLCFFFFFLSKLFRLFQILSNPIWILELACGFLHNVVVLYLSWQPILSSSAITTLTLPCSLTLPPNNFTEESKSQQRVLSTLCYQIYKLTLLCFPPS